MRKTFCFVQNNKRNARQEADTVIKISTEGLRLHLEIDAWIEMISKNFKKLNRNQRWFTDFKNRKFISSHRRKQLQR